MSGWATSCPIPPTSRRAAASIRAARSPSRAAPSRRRRSGRDPPAAWSVCSCLSLLGARHSSGAIFFGFDKDARPESRAPSALLPLRKVEARQLVGVGLEVEALAEGVGVHVGEQRQPIGLLGQQLDGRRVGLLANRGVAGGAALR